MTASGVIIMNIVITVIGILLALFVNARYGVLLKNAGHIQIINRIEKRQQAGAARKRRSVTLPSCG